MWFFLRSHTGQRRIEPTANMMAVYQVNPNAQWFVKCDHRNGMTHIWLTWYVVWVDLLELISVWSVESVKPKIHYIIFLLFCFDKLKKPKFYTVHFINMHIAYNILLICICIIIIIIFIIIAIPTCLWVMIPTTIMT